MYYMFALRNFGNQKNNIHLPSTSGPAVSRRRNPSSASRLSPVGTCWDPEKAEVIASGDPRTTNRKRGQNLGRLALGNWRAQRKCSTERQIGEKTHGDPKDSEWEGGMKANEFLQASGAKGKTKQGEADSHTKES